MGENDAILNIGYLGQVKEYTFTEAAYVVLGPLITARCRCVPGESYSDGHCTVWVDTDADAERAWRASGGRGVHLRGRHVLWLIDDRDR